MASSNKIFNLKNLVLLFWSVFIFGWLCVFGLFWGLSKDIGGFFGDLPKFDELENPNSAVASHIYSADSVLLGKYFLENRTDIPYDYLSKTVLNTLMATEDIRFHKHSGVDILGVATIPYYLLSGKRRGSSTITQQLARNLYSTSTSRFDGKLTKTKYRTIVIKLKEWITATKIEKSYTKEEIIAMYLNTVDFGSNAFGIKVAAKTYFNKDQNDLKYEESAVLVGLLKATYLYNPFYNPEKAHKRRNTVVDQLFKYKFITKTLKDSIKSSQISLNYKVENQNQGYATYFREEAKKFIKTWCESKGYDIYRDGLVIYSTIDSRLQKYAELSMEEHLKEHQAKFFTHWKGKNPWTLKEDNVYKEIPNFLETHIKRSYNYRVYKTRFDGDSVKIEEALRRKRKMKVFTWKGEIDTLFNDYDSLSYYKHFLQAGFMSMDPNSGQIKAWVGGINYKYFKYDHVQQGKRQPGSTFKPIVYATILGEIGQDYGPCYQAIDAPVTFVTGDTANPVWTPENSDGKYTGEMLTLRQALAQSKNSITAYMMKVLGEQTPIKVLEYATRMGINTEKFEAVPAMCLGTFDVSLFELLGAYATFMNKGIHQNPYFIKAIYDKNGNLLEEFKPERNAAISEELAYTMTYMLRGATTERNGTALGLSRWDLLWGGNEIAAKTGTTQDYSDGWFVSLIPQLVTGAWVGCEDRVVHFRTFDFGQGARMAMPIVGKFLQKAYQDPKTGIIKQLFKEPDAITKESFKIKTNCKDYNSPKSDSDMMKSNTIDINTKDEEFEFK